MANIQYGYWRTEKAPEDGFSHELVSVFSDKNALDDLNTYPKNKDGSNITTLTEALESLYQRMPNHPWLGSKVSNSKDAQGKPIWSYEWMTVKEVYLTAQKFGAGLMAKNLIPEVEGEGQ